MIDENGFIYDKEEEVKEASTLPEHRKPLVLPDNDGTGTWKEEQERNDQDLDYAVELQGMRNHWRKMLMAFKNEKAVDEKKVLSMIRAMLALESNGTTAKDRIAAMKQLCDTYGFNKQKIEHSTPDAYNRELSRLGLGVKTSGN